MPHSAEEIESQKLSMYEHWWIGVEALLVGHSLQGVISADQLKCWAAEKNSHSHPEQWISDCSHYPPHCQLTFPQNLGQNCWSCHHWQCPPTKVWTWDHVCPHHQNHQLTHPHC